MLQAFKVNILYKQQINRTFIEHDEKTIPNIIRFKRKVQKANGDKNTQPQLVDAEKRPLDKIVGNGSRVKVMYKPYEWNFKGKKGVGLDLQAVQVLDLIEYTPKEDFDVEAGNTSGGNVDNIKEFQYSQSVIRSYGCHISTPRTVGLQLVGSPFLL